MEWQPIETIPKDGSRVLLFDGTDVIFGFYANGWRKSERRRILDEHVRGESQGQDGDSADVPYATHWMPLPEAPNVELSGREKKL